MTDAPSAALGGRYHFQAPFRYQDDTLRWLARDERTGEDVVVALVENARVSKLECIKGFTHPHLAALVDVIHKFDASVIPGGAARSDGALLVAEHVAGRTLRQQLGEGPLAPARAVAWWLRLAHAVAEIHGRGGVLGGISPFSITTKADGRAIPPVLTQLVAPVVGAALAPERLKGNAPDASDDVWALYASLYWALTGVAPFPGNSREELLKDIAAGPPTPLSAFGLKDKELEEIMKRGLTGDSAQRAVDIQELIKSLDAWERGLQLPPRPKRGLAPRSLSGIVKGGLTPPIQLGRVAFNPSSLPEQFGPDAKGSLPARARVVSDAAIRSATQTPVPAEVVGETESSPGIETPALAPAVPAPKRPSVNPFAKKRSIWPVLLGLGVVIGAVVAFFSFAPVRNGAAPPASSTAAAEPAAPKPSTSTAAASRAPSSPAQSLNACVQSYFADETFAPAVQLGFVCEAGDHRDTTNKLYELSEAKADLEARRLEAMADAGPPQKPDGGFQVDTVVSDAGGGRVRRPLGWYELLSTAIVRKGCCPNAVPVTLPETTGWCEQLQDVVRDLADDSARAGDLAPRVKRFDKAVDCLFANRVRRPYNEYKTAPLTPENRSAFQQFLSHAAVSDAQRRTLLP